MSNYFDKNIVEFATVAAEYCGFVEQATGAAKSDFVDKSVKLLALLYLKGTMLGKSQDDFYDEYVEEFVSELDWQTAQNGVSGVLGQHDVYFSLPEKQDEFTVEDSTVCLSECYADIYQDMKNFVERFKVGEPESMQTAIALCQNGFFSVWGSRVLGVLQELHLLIAGGEDLTDDSGSSSYNNFENELS